MFKNCILNISDFRKMFKNIYSCLVFLACFLEGLGLGWSSEVSDFPPPWSNNQGSPSFLGPLGAVQLTKRDVLLPDLNKLRYNLPDLVNGVINNNLSRQKRSKTVKNRFIPNTLSPFHLAVNNQISLRNKRQLLELFNEIKNRVLDLSESALKTAERFKDELVGLPGVVVSVLANEYKNGKKTFKSVVETGRNIAEIIKGREDTDAYNDDDNAYKDRSERNSGLNFYGAADSKRKRDIQINDDTANNDEIKKTHSNIVDVVREVLSCLLKQIIRVIAVGYQQSKDLTEKIIEFIKIIILPNMKSKRSIRSMNDRIEDTPELRSKRSIICDVLDHTLGLPGKMLKSILEITERILIYLFQIPQNLFRLPLNLLGITECLSVIPEDKGELENIVEQGFNSVINLANQVLGGENVPKRKRDVGLIKNDNPLIVSLGLVLSNTIKDIEKFIADAKPKISNELNRIIEFINKMLVSKNEERSVRSIEERLDLSFVNFVKEVLNILLEFIGRVSVTVHDWYTVIPKAVKEQLKNIRGALIKLRL